MPLYDFICYTCGFQDEMITGAGDMPICPRCGDPLTRMFSASFSVPASSTVTALESVEAALFSPAERAAAARDGRRLVTGPADIARYERENGLHRVDPGNPSVQANYQDQLDLAHDDAEVRQREGAEGLADRIVQDEVTSLTGWDKTHYSKWKGAQDAAIHAVESGAVAVPADQ